MTRALEKLKLQSTTTNSGSTSTVRVEQRGVGLTGAVIENYLVQVHSKADSAHSQHLPFSFLLFIYQM